MRVVAKAQRDNLRLREHRMNWNVNAQRRCVGDGRCGKASDGNREGQDGTDFRVHSSSRYFRFGRDSLPWFRKLVVERSYATCFILVPSFDKLNNVLLL